MSDVAERWSSYARCWSLPAAERSRLLPQHVGADVAYCDPGNAVVGVQDLDRYMDQFQTAFPTQRFEIRSVQAHHDRSIARWEQVAHDGSVIMVGTSAARHDQSGRLVDIVGFFAGVS